MPTSKTSFSTSFSLPAGFQELSSDTLARRRAVEAQLLTLFGQYGFEEVDVSSLEYEPLYEPTRMGHDLFHHLICGRISERRDFDLDGRRTSVRTVVLRPDFIAPIARRFVTEALSSGWPPYLPVRWSYAGQVFQNVQAQGGRRREFRQLGAALIGVGHRQATMELLTLAVDAAERLSLPKWSLSLGHAGLYETLLGAIGVAPEVRGLVSSAFRSYVRSHHRAQASAGAFLSWAEKSAPQTSRKLREVRLHDRKIKEIMDLAALGGSLESVFDSLERYRGHEEVDRLLEDLRWHSEELFARRGVRPSIDPSVRGSVTYYEGVTFELQVAKEDRSIKVASGGRYARELYEWVLQRARATQSLRAGRAAELSERDERLCGAGFVFGLERLLEAFEQPKPAGGLSVFVAIQNEAHTQAAARFAAKIRARGASAIAHIPRDEGVDGLREQLGRAKHLNAKWTVIFADEEQQRGMVALKEMATEAQETCSIEQVETKIFEENTP